MQRFVYKLSKFWLVLMLGAGLSMWSFAQDTPQDTSGQEPSASGAPPAATGLDTTSQAADNPPLSGLDQPSFEPGFGARSYLAPSAQVTEAVGSNPTAQLGGSGVYDATRVTGSLLLQKLWKIHPLDLDYTGGVARFNGINSGTYQLHTLGAVQRILWRTGQLNIRDGFSYLPQGTFGYGSFGGAGGFTGIGGLGGGIGGIAGGGGGGTFTNVNFASIGNQPRINNISIVDVSQAISPRSTVTMGGGFGVLHFLNNLPGYINSQQTTAQAGYSYQLSRHNQIGAAYAFQEFHFPKAGAGGINVSVWQVFFGHRISGRLDFNAGGGPQWIHINTVVPVTVLGFRILVPIHDSRLSAAGHVGLTYLAGHNTSMNLNYLHYTTPGSGLFAGANTDAVTYTVNHKITRRWDANVNTGYSRNSRLNNSFTSQTAGNARAFGYWFAGAGLRRHLSPQFDAFASYQYDKFGLGAGYCKTAGCNSGYNRHIGMIGLGWTPHPIRLD